MPKETSTPVPETSTTPAPVDAVLDNFIERLQGKKIKHQPLIVRDGEHFEATVKEIRALVARNPKHPIAQVFANATLGQPETDKVVIDKADLEAVIDNREVIINSAVELQADGSTVTVERKVLGKKLS